jgi:sugar O-acyltransferase (sialic acid O-acetyltransferase NeuD family)
MEDIQYNKKEFLILGAGGLGREMYSWICQSEKFLNFFNCAGFLDDNLGKLSKFSLPIEIIGDFKFMDKLNNQHFLIALSNPEIKEKIWTELEVLNHIIIGYIHDSTLLGLQSSINSCLITFPNVIISCNVKIGKGVFINNGSQIGHDSVIGDFVSLMANVDIGGNCEVGNKVFVGSGATILPGVKIPDNTIIGAGAVVFRTIKIAGTYIGNPAIKIF